VQRLDGGKRRRHTGPENPCDRWGCRG
jgi:hypothetical protein